MSTLRNAIDHTAPLANRMTPDGTTLTFVLTKRHEGKTCYLASDLYGPARTPFLEEAKLFRSEMQASSYADSRFGIDCGWKPQGFVMTPLHATEGAHA